MMNQEYSGYNDFDPLLYIKKKYSFMSEYVELFLKDLHNLFNNPSLQNDLKVLEFGCGPVPIFLCSAPIKASEIVCAEYEERNRDILQSWMNKEPTAPDYTHIFKYVVQELEGQTGEEPVSKRQDDLRSLVKAVVPCDATKDPPIDSNYQGPYNIIICSNCLCVASKNISEYSLSVRRLANMLKSGGKIVINAREARHGQDHYSYWVGKEKYSALSISVEAIKSILKENKFVDIKVTYRLIDDPPGLRKFVSPEVIAILFVSATKE